MKFYLLLSLSIGTLALTHCGSSEPKFRTTERSVGQQLTDLDQAHSQKVISDKEYKKLKKAIIKAND
jgi:hypothetical protein